MVEQSLMLKLSAPGKIDDATSRLRREYQAYQSLFQLQAPMVQQYLGAQASALAQALLQKSYQAQFSLPDRVTVQTEDMGIKTLLLPAGERRQRLGGFIRHLVRTDLFTILCLRFLELEKSSNQAVSASSILIRHTLAMHMVYQGLPSGKTVQYEALEEDEIPSIPVMKDFKSRSELTTRSDSIYVERGQENLLSEEEHAPYVEAASRFYLPQWVVFDEEGRLLPGSLGEAEAAIASMQHYLWVLRAAVGMAPYLVADEEYQRKHYGILGQLVNQGRALANYKVGEIVRTIHRRVAAHSLDRGLRLSLPYFNDQTLAMESFSFDVIPAGRVMFVPAFVVLAARTQGRKIAQDTRLSRSTRRHLLTEFGILEKIFLRY